MITIYRVFISIHFIKTVTTAFTWNKRLNCGISDDTNLASSPYHAANKYLSFCFLGFYILLNICFIGYFLLAFIQSHTIVFFYISSIFLWRSLQMSLNYLADTSFAIPLKLVLKEFYCQSILCPASTINIFVIQQTGPQNSC